MDAQLAPPLTTKEVLATLAQFQAERGDEYRITRLGVFGSVARGTAHVESDIDVVVELIRPDLLTLAGIKMELEEIFNREVDVIEYYEEMNPFLKRRIHNEAIYVRPNVSTRHSAKYQVVNADGH